MNSSINRSGHFSLYVIIPLFFIVTLIFLYFQLNKVLLYHYEMDIRKSSYDHFQSILMHNQGTINNLMKQGLHDEIRFEIKLQTIHEEQINMAAIVDDHKQILNLSNRRYRADIVNALDTLFNQPGFRLAVDSEKVFIHAANDNHHHLDLGVESHEAHSHIYLGIVPLQPKINKTEDYRRYLLMEYDYTVQIDQARYDAQYLFNISSLAATLIFTILGIFGYHLFFKRISQLQHAAETIRKGQYGIQLPTGGFTEISNIIKTFNNMSLTIKEKIGELNKIQTALINEKEAAQNYLDIVGVMILVVDRDMRVKLINQRGCEIIGYDADEIIGKNWIENFLPRRYRQEVHDVSDTLIRPDNNPIRTFENPVLTKSGEERLIAWRNTTLFDKEGNVAGILTSGEDITDIRLAESRLKESEQFFRNVFTSVHEAMFILYDMIIVDCNDHTSTIFEQSRESLVGTPLSQHGVIQCKDDSFESCVNRALQGDVITSKCLLFLPNHSVPKIVKFTLTPMGDDLERVICVMHDITVELEKEKMFISNSRQAQMGEMIAMIAHQWRQPLATITAISTKLTLDEMMKPETDDELLGELQKIEHQVSHLSQTITDFRDFFRPDKPSEEVNLDQLVNSAITLLDHALKSNNITVNKKVADETLTVKTYRNEVLQVMMSLVKNSLDAFIENEIKDRIMTFTVSGHDDRAEIAISDNAGGIDPAIINDIFMPYFTTKDSKKGTGLGLYMSKTVIEDHCKGKLQVTSDAGMTHFVITLPLEKDT